MSNASWPFSGETEISEAISPFLVSGVTNKASKRNAKNSLSKEQYNILVIGKTGVGKSSFINYFLGEDIAQTGVGKPVTERGFHQYSFKLDNLTTELYDSWGLEADKHEEWLAKFNKELEERGVDKPATEWFHSVFYCINAGGHRVEDADINIIEHLRQKQYPVSVILTKSDMITEEEEASLKKAILQAINGVQVVSISVGAKTRSGVAEPFGKNEAQEIAKNDFFNSLVERLPAHFTEVIRERKENWRDAVEREIASVGYLNEKEIFENIKNISQERTQEIVNEITQELTNTLNTYKKIISSIGLNFDFNISSKESGSMKWWEWAVMIPFTPAIILGGLIFGRKLNRNNLNESFDKFYEEFSEATDKWVVDLREKLIELKNKRHLALPHDPKQKNS